MNRLLQCGVCIIITILSTLIITVQSPAIPKADSFAYPVGQPNEKPTNKSGNRNGYLITQEFGAVYKKMEGDKEVESKHTGVDLANGQSGGEVRATAAGKVIYRQDSDKKTGWGYMVRIEHHLPSGDVVYSQYGHLLSGSILVEKGQTIGKVGSTGRSSGAHLHFEIKKNNTSGGGYDPPSKDALILLKQSNELQRVGSETLFSYFRVR